MRFGRGFTVVELVVVIVLMGILAAYASTLLNTAATNAHSYADSVKGILRYSQKVAIAQNRTTYVTINTDVVLASICTSASCAATIAVAEPVSGSDLTISVPSNVTLTTSLASVIFNALGESNNNALGLLTITGSDATRLICIAIATGYVYDC